MKKFLIKNSFDSANIPAVYFKKTKDINNSKSFVFFHGLGTDKFEYLDFYKILGDKLSELGHNVLCFDARSHGDSTESSDKFTVSNLISDGIEAIKWLLKQEDLSQVTLFGTSFGAIPSICIAHMLPELIKNVYLLAPVSDFEKLYLNPISQARAKRYKGLIDRCVYEGKPFEINDRLAFNRKLVIEFSLIFLPDLVRKSKLNFEVLHGTGDTMVSYDLSVKLSEDNKHVSLYTFDNMDHGFMEVGDEEGNSKKTLGNIERIISILVN